MLVTVDLPDALVDALRAEAARRGVSIDVEIIESITEHLDIAGRRRRLAISRVGARPAVHGAGPVTPTSCSARGSVGTEPEPRSGTRHHRGDGVGRGWAAGFPMLVGCAP